MAQNPIGMNEPEFIEVLDTEDDLVQVLGVTPPEGESEIEVSSIEIDDGESFLIDIDEVSPFDDINGQEDVFEPNDVGLIDTDSSDSDLGEI